MNRVSAAVLAIGCLLTGYGLAGSRVGATADDTVVVRRLPDGVNVGDHVRLTFVAGALGGNNPGVVECTVAGLWGGWVRCATDASAATSGRPFTPPPGEISLQPDESAVWYDLMRVVMVRRPAR
jgi:hypothetical protein